MAYNTKSIKRDLQGVGISQFFNPTADDYQQNTGADLGGGRYGADTLSWGKTSGGVFVPIQVGAAGEVVTQVTGRNTELITQVNAVAVTDITVRFSTLALNKYKEYDLIVTNTHNQPVWIGFTMDGTYPSIAMSDGTLKSYSPFTGSVYHAVPAGAENVYLSTLPLTLTNKTTPFKDYLNNNCSIAYKFNTAPTSGALTIKLQGVIN